MAVSLQLGLDALSVVSVNERDSGGSQSRGITFLDLGG